MISHVAFYLLRVLKMRIYIFKKAVLLTLLLLHLTSCRSVTIYVVPDSNYLKMTYEQRMIYLSKLYKANELNKQKVRGVTYVIIE